MSTGYTYAIVENKINFPQFAMRCAKAFGACVTLRETGVDVPIPKKLIPSPYYKQEAEESRKELFKLKAMTLGQADKLAKKEYIKEVRENKRYFEEKQKETELYKNMLERVKEWKTPSRDYSELKNFMIEQIKMSMHPKIELENVQEKTGTRYREELISDVKSDIKNYKKEYKEEVERTNERNKWLQGLRSSLPTN